jgi:hypothetical protein
MIYKDVNKRRTSFKFVFTGRHIYCFIHSISETNKDLKIIDQIIINYENNEEINKYKEQLKNHINYGYIIAAIDNMMTGKPTLFHEEIEEGKTFKTEKLIWFNNLYLDQLSSNIRPPITILEPEYKYKYKYK